MAKICPDRDPASVLYYQGSCSIFRKSSYQCLLLRNVSRNLFDRPQLIDLNQHDLAFGSWRVCIIPFPPASILTFLRRIQPVGSQILSNIQISGHSWNLWKGPNANWQVLSFVSASGEIHDFEVDLNDFFSKHTGSIFVGVSRIFDGLTYRIPDREPRCCFDPGMLYF